MHPLRTAFVVVLTACVLAACQSTPVTGRKQFMVVPESQAIEASKQAYVRNAPAAAEAGQGQQ